MTAFIDEIRTLTNDLTELGVSWALVGALACSVYAEPRTTKDIDIAVAINNTAALEDLIGRLTARGYSNPQLLLHASPAFSLGYRLFIPGKKAYSIPLDVLNNSCGMEYEVVSFASTIEILPNVSIPVARLGHLIAMKVLSQNLSDRIRDRSDLMAMLAVTDASELSLCREALSLITQRGFDRGRALEQTLDELLTLSGHSAP